MPAIFPVSNGRVSDLLVQQRLLTQLDFEQRSLLTVQDQIATGRRISTPSQDAPAAFQAILLQRLLERKGQVQQNVDVSSSYLSAAESAIAGVSDLLSDIRGLAISAADAGAGDAQRDAVAQEIGGAISQLLDIGNQRFRGRYLFGGTATTAPPFERTGVDVIYRGNESHLRTFADLNLLVETNVHGSELFGAVSEQILGTSDLNPILAAGTRLQDLRGGEGISGGSILVSDGTTASTIDFSGADTVGDVIRLLEGNPPPGRQVTVRLSATGLILELDPEGGDTLVVNEVGGGSTASELGILSQGNTQPLLGGDLNPRLTATTRLSSLLGVRSQARLQSPGTDNDVILEARANGSELNGVTLQLVDDELLLASPGLNAGNERVLFTDVPVAAQASLALFGTNNNLQLTANVPGTAANNISIRIVGAGAIGNTANASFDAGSRTLILEVDSSGATQVQTLVSAINAEGTFTATPDVSEPDDGVFLPNASVPASPAVGNTGNSGADANTILVYVDAGDTNAEQIVEALNNDPDVSSGFTARLDPKDTGNLAGRGTVDVDASAITAGGGGEIFDQASGIRVTNGQVEETLTFEDAETVEDLLNVINRSELGLLAEINADGSGINVHSRLSGGDFSLGENGGSTATQLGIRTFTRETQVASLNHGFGIATGTGSDFTIRRSDGVELAIDVSAAVTVGDVIDLINTHPDNLDPTTAVVAQIAAVGNGLELLEAEPAAGSLTVIRQPSNQAAWGLGLIPAGDDEFTATPAVAATADLVFSTPDNINKGITLLANQPGTTLNGVTVEFVNDLAVGDQALVTFNAITQTLRVDVSPGSTSANTVLSAINLEGTFSASLNTTADPTNDGSGLIQDTGVLAVTSGGDAQRLQGADVNGWETRGVFNTLIRLQAAVTDFDLPQIERTLAMLDEDFDRVNFVRAEIGSRQRTMDTLRDRLVTENTELQAALSLEIDVDMVKAVTELTSRQAALEASLRLIGQTFQLTLLDFL